MLRRILRNILIIIIILSLHICATEVEVGNSTEGQTTEGNQDIVQNNTPQEGNGNTNVNSNTNPATNPDTNQNSNPNNNPNNNQVQNNNSNNQNDAKPNTQKNGTSSNKSQNSTTNNTLNKSKIADLKSLEIDIDGLSPEFNKNTTDYYLVVDLSVTQIEVKATPADSKAKVIISGNKNIKEGENIITIKVTAENGTTKKYNIHVTKIDDVEMADAQLKSLEIEGYNVSPSFKPNIYNYSLNINENIDHLDIEAQSEKEEAKVKISGNDNMQEGENLIEINVTAEDGITVRTYKINTYISYKSVQILEESKVPAVILIVILSGCMVALGAFVYIKNKK